MIIVNARFLTQPTTGVQRFAIEISKELKKSKLQAEFVAPKNIIHKELAKDLDVKIIGCGLKGHQWEQIALQYYVFKKKALLISLCNTAPIFVKNQIVTIHDLAFMVQPKWMSKSFALAYRIVIPLIAKRSKQIITVSETSKNEIANKLNIPRQKIEVVYNAVSTVFLSEQTSVDSTNNSDNYILTVSSHHPRKNFQNLIEAFKLVPDEDLKLYVIGNFNNHFSNTGVNQAFNSRIKFIENVSDNDLLKYYKNTKLFVYPSLYEGFGIPIIEAMSQGILVCVSNIEVFHEVCGNKAIYFDPLDIIDIKNKIIQGLKYNGKLEYDLKKYNWNKSFKKLEKCIFALK